MIEDAKEQARLEGERIVSAAHSAVEQEVAQTRAWCREDFARQS